MILLIPEHNRMGFMLGIPGLVLQTGSSFLAPMFQPMLGSSATILTSVLSLCGMALVIAGLAYVAMAKGYHFALGFLGLLSCIGLIILAVLPDKTASMPPRPTSRSRAWASPTTSTPGAAWMSMPM